MKLQRWFPHPYLSLLLVVIWLLLVNSLAPGHLLLGTLLAILIPRFTNAFWTDRPQQLHLRRLVVFTLRVIWDILVANIQVAKLILGPARNLQPAFIHYPLELRSEFAITVLANTISLTPGTVTAHVSEDGTSLLIHALDVDNEEAVLRHIRERYEIPLKEIFEC
jgi:multicomponent K+:H+ antiporter subunit E